MSVGKLILHPQSPFAPPPSIDALTTALREIELLGGEIPARSEGTRFLAGERFLQLVSFLGCSPHINLEPPPDQGDNFCYLELLGPYELPRFLRGLNTRPPGCPECGRKQPDYREQFAPWQPLAQSLSWACPHCGTENHPADWNWRQQGGAGRILVLINSIFPNEALPGDELLACLRRLGGEPWGYFYIQDLE